MVFFYFRKIGKSLKSFLENVCVCVWISLGWMPMAGGYWRVGGWMWMMCGVWITRHVCYHCDAFADESDPKMLQEPSLHHRYYLFRNEIQIIIVVIQCASFFFCHFTYSIFWRTTIRRSQFSTVQQSHLLSLRLRNGPLHSSQLMIQNDYPVNCVKESINFR